MIEGKNVKFKTNNAAPTSKFSLSGNASKLMGILTDIYSDPIAAVVREITTNALEANALNGHQRPIEITMPSLANPQFRVRDFGKGMSQEFVLQAYTQYGFSTKDKINYTEDGVALDGAKGIGSKAPLAYTQSFTIETASGGVQNTYVVQWDRYSAPNITQVSSVECGEHTGTEISVPVLVDDIASFEKAVKDFLQHITEPYLVNGEEVDYSAERIFEGETWFVTSQAVFNTDRVWKHGVGYVYTSSGGVIMGRILYPMPDRIDNTYGIVLKLPMGSVNVAPNREELTDDVSTRNIIKEGLRVASQEIRELLIEKIKNIKSFRELLTLHRDISWQLRRVVPDNDWKFDNVSVFRVVDFDEYRIYTRQMVDAGKQPRSADTGTRMRMTELLDKPDSTVFIHRNTDSWRIMRRLRTFFTKHPTVQQAIVIKEKPSVDGVEIESVWDAISPYKIADYEPVKVARGKKGASSTRNLTIRRRRYLHWQIVSDRDHAVLVKDPHYYVRLDRSANYEVNNAVIEFVEEVIGSKVYGVSAGVAPKHWIRLKDNLDLVEKNISPEIMELARQNLSTTFIKDMRSLYRWSLWPMWSEAAVLEVGDPDLATFQQIAQSYHRTDAVGKLSESELLQYNMALETLKQNDPDYEKKVRADFDSLVERIKMRYTLLSEFWYTPDSEAVLEYLKLKYNSLIGE